jgi:hypothetical protein
MNSDNDMKTLNTDSIQSFEEALKKWESQGYTLFTIPGLGTVKVAKMNEIVKQIHSNDPKFIEKKIHEQVMIGVRDALELYLDTLDKKFQELLANEKVYEVKGGLYMPDITRGRISALSEAREEVKNLRNMINNKLTR